MAARKVREGGDRRDVPPCPNAGLAIAARRPCLTVALDAWPEPKDQAGYPESRMGWYGFWKGPVQRDLLSLCDRCARGLPRVLAGVSLWTCDVGADARAFTAAAAFRAYRAAVKAEDKERLAPYPRTA